jgi:pimeloyl-ACP methyl ester carboxylesterase
MSAEQPAVDLESLTIASGLARLAGECCGAGFPVVFLHAGVADRRMWRDQLTALARDPAMHRGVAYDRRGFGDSLHVEERYSHIDDLIAVLDAVAPRASVVLVGCSQGGRIAIDTALAHPDRVRALVLVAPAISGAPEAADDPPAIQSWIDRMEAAEAAADVDRINMLEAHAWLDGPLAKEGRVTGPARELFFAMNDIALRAEQRGTPVEPAPAFLRVHEIAVPALVIWGELDFPRVVRHCEYLVAQLPRAQSWIVRDAAHLPNLEHADAFNRVLLDFLAGIAR